MVRSSSASEGKLWGGSERQRVGGGGSPTVL